MKLNDVHNIDDFMTESRNRDSYQRDYDFSKTGFGRPGREDDEYVNGGDRLTYKVRAIVTNPSGAKEDRTVTITTNKGPEHAKTRSIQHLEGKGYTVLQAYDPVEQGLAEGSNYAEQLAQQVFNENPNLVSSGSAEEVLGAAYTIARDELGDRRARMLFTYSEDFPGDLVTNYAHLQKQGMSEGLAMGMEEEMTRNPEYADQAGSVIENLYDIVRMCKTLKNTLEDNEQLPVWCIEKVAKAQGMMNAVSNYIETKHDKGEVYTMDSKSVETPDYAEMFESKLMEFSSAGGGAGSIASSAGIMKNPAKVGSLFGGSYTQKNSPFKTKKPKKTGMIKR